MVWDIRQARKAIAWTAFWTEARSIEALRVFTLWKKRPGSGRSIKPDAHFEKGEVRLLVGAIDGNLGYHVDRHGILEGSRLKDPVRSADSGTASLGAPIQTRISWSRPSKRSSLSSHLRDGGLPGLGRSGLTRYSIAPSTCCPFLIGRQPLVFLESPGASRRPGGGFIR